MSTPRIVTFCTRLTFRNMASHNRNGVRSCTSMYLGRDETDAAARGPSP